MSRIGRLPIAIPSGVDVQIESGLVRVKGPKGELSQTVSRDEFGYRYDAQGNRIDATGRIVAVPANRY